MNVNQYCLSNLEELDDNSNKQAIDIAERGEPKTSFTSLQTLENLNK